MGIGDWGLGPIPINKETKNNLLIFNPINKNIYIIYLTTFYQSLNLNKNKSKKF